MDFQRFRLLVYAYNATGMGPKTLTLRLLDSIPERELSECLFLLPRIPSFEAHGKRGNVLLLPILPKPFQYLLRMFIDLILYPALLLLSGAQSSLALANYLPFPSLGEKTICIRHSYLLDEEDLAKLGFARKLLESIRRLLLRLSLIGCKYVVVQSQRAKELFSRKYGQREGLCTMANPILLDEAKASAKVEMKAKHPIIYVARYYPHKNHGFLLDLAFKYQDELRDLGFTFYLTLGGKSEVRTFLAEVRGLALDDLIINLGELTSKEISCCYDRATCLFHPSRSESFGNVLLEAMAKSLPIVLPAKPYGRELCKEAALYYPQDSVKEALETIKEACLCKSTRYRLKENMRSRVKDFPSLSQWWSKIKALSLDEG